MRDVHGIVHLLMHNGSGGWFWPTGHADASLRQAEPVRSAGFVTCFRCIDEHQRYNDYLARTGR